MSRDRTVINNTGGGDIIGVNVSGTGNIVGKQITLGNLSVNAQQLEKVSDKYAESLQEFSMAVNEQIKAHNISREQIAPTQEGLENLTKEVSGLKEGEVLIAKKKKMNAIISDIATNLIRVLPKTAETIATFTPLAPFSKLIGESVEGIVKAVQSESQG